MKLAANANRQFHFERCRQLFIGTHNEPHPVTAMHVCNPNGSSLKIEGSKPSSNSYQ
jgi:hypothetical protein